MSNSKQSKQKPSTVLIYLREMWKDFQIFLGINIPSEIVAILTANGYNDPMLLSGMELEEIVRIEKFTDEKLQHVLKQCQYPSEKPFCFLPGHKKLLLLLGQKAKIYEPSASKTGNENVLDFNEVTNIMKDLINTMKANSNVAPTSRRYSENIQWFATYIYILSGKAAYEVLSKNLPLPQIPTIMNYISQRKKRVIEGQLRCQELAEYLRDLKAPKKVWISEDASGIVAQVSYDSSTNQLVGLVLPTNHTGMPIPFSFTPQSMNDIEEQINQNPKSKLVYLVLAQPLMDNVPPFILQVFGTDNRFKTEDVLLRWKQMKDQLAMCDIEIAGISADGDARLLVSMKQSLNAMCNQLSSDILSNLNYEQSISFIQDIFHLATKIRNRLLQLSILLPMGFFQVSVSHLKILIKTVRKEIHGLVLSDICPEDRQNFASFEKVSSNRVLSALTKYVPHSEATVKYLKLSRDITDAFTKVDLSPLERVSMVWRSLYFFRAWKQWISTYEPVKYHTEDNFISQNAFTCLELNAYGILHLIRKFREAKQSHLFLITLFNSQPCERTFRQLRSMTTANWTKINFSMLELLHMISRVELQNDIAYFRMPDVAILPRIQNRCENHKLFEMPTDEDLRSTLEESLQEALLDAAKLGMKIDADHIQRCEITKGNVLFRKVDDLNEPIESDEIDTNNLADDMVDFTYFRDYSETVSGFDGNSRFIQVCDEGGSTKLIRKSAIVSMITDSPMSLSKDRLERVKLPKEIASNKRKSQLRDDIPLVIKSFPQCGLRVEKQIDIGQWCIFRYSGEEHHMLSENDLNENIIIGCVLSFKYMDGKTKKDRQYGLDVAPTSPSVSNNRGIGVLSLWHRLKNDLRLELFSVPSFFNSMENYVVTIESPEFDLNQTSEEKSYKLSGNVDEYKKALLELLS